MSLYFPTSLHPSLIQGASLEQWNDANWQLRHSFTQAAQLEGYLQLSADESAALQSCGEKLSLRITPHFLSLIDPADPSDPLRLQVIPREAELRHEEGELLDPCGEDADMKAPGLVHRYPDRALLLCSDRCATYCRYCTRSRMVSGGSKCRMPLNMDAAIDYIKAHPELRDILLSGGDPLLLSNEKLREILSRLREIPHIEFLRIGTRVPIMLPQRITDELCAMLREFAPLFISVHCNHARELCSAAEEALGRLVDHGIPLGSQSVLLRGVNDDAATQRALYHRLLCCRVRPYYLYHCDPVSGSSHFRTSIKEGLDIIDSLRGHTTGYAVPDYVMDAPGGGGKVPLTRESVLRINGGIAVRNYRGDIYHYPSAE